MRALGASPKRIGENSGSETDAVRPLARSFLATFHNRVLQGATGVLEVWEQPVPTKPRAQYRIHRIDIEGAVARTLF
jgi:hypothetical protein